VPLPYDTGKPSLSAAAIADPPVYNRARAARVIPRHEGVPLFGRWMAAAGAELLADADASSSRPCWHKRLSVAQRRKNVAGTFRVTALREQIQGKRIVVDDVITTGATAEACAQVLKRAGAVRVDVLALARAVEPSHWLL
jgi:orotate phosphoribosyltransferase-like protein